MTDEKRPENEPFDPDFDAELREAFEVRKNWLALHTAIRVSYANELPESQQPDLGPIMHGIPLWVLDACYDLVTAQLTSAAQAITEPGAGGRHARWLTRFRSEVKDKRRGVVFGWCEGQGITKEEALAATADYFEEPEKTVEKAIARARRRGAPVFQPVQQPSSRRYVDPLDGEGYGTHEDNPDAFASLVNAVAGADEARCSPEVVRCVRLAQRVADTLKRSR